MTVASPRERSTAKPGRATKVTRSPAEPTTADSAGEMTQRGQESWPINCMSPASRRTLRARWTTGTGLTHVDATGAARMVDVSDQGRDRTASGRRRLGPDHGRGGRPAAPRRPAQGRRARRWPGSPASWAPSARRTSSRCAIRSRCTASRSTSTWRRTRWTITATRAHRRPDRRRDGGADRGGHRRARAHRHDQGGRSGGRASTRSGCCARRAARPASG